MAVNGTAMADDHRGLDDDHHRALGSWPGACLRLTLGSQALLGPVAGPAFRVSADPGGTPMTAGERTQLLDAAERVFARAGFRGASIEAIAAEAGYPRR